MSNKKLGSDFEKHLSRLLYEDGFWVHNFANKTNGQPADIIAVKNHCSFLIDAKVCTNDIFDTTRVEENQKNSMFLWGLCGNGNGYFALETSDGIYFIDSTTILMYRQEKRTINLSEIKCYGTPYDEWRATIL